MSKRSKFCIVGVPDHQGVIHVKGRIGAARGPNAFRRCFGRLLGQYPVKASAVDWGDVKGLTSNVIRNHELAKLQIREAHQKFGLSVVVGGGHDHCYPHLAGVLEALKGESRSFRLGCINLDAHLDVRKPNPQITSGSGFYLALESGILNPQRFLEFGAQTHCNTAELWDYLKAKKVSSVPFAQIRGGKAVSRFSQELKKLRQKCDAIVLSFDLDSVASGFAPGVSAPQAEGFSSTEIIEIMEIAGRDKKVISLGVFELNPEHDWDDCTARLAATSVYHFIASKLF